MCGEFSRSVGTGSWAGGFVQLLVVQRASESQRTTGGGEAWCAGRNGEADDGEGPSLAVPLAVSRTLPLAVPLALRPRLG